MGFVGGVDIPLIQKFEAGYIQGAKAAAPKIQIEKKYITPAGDFTGFQDPPKGQEAAKGLIDKGADVIYQAAGASGKGVFSAAKSGAACWPSASTPTSTTRRRSPSTKDVIVSSMLKRVDVAVYDFIKAVAKNDLASLPKVFDLKVDGVGYATSGGKIDDEAAGHPRGLQGPDHRGQDHGRGQAVAAASKSCARAGPCEETPSQGLVRGRRSLNDEQFDVRGGRMRPPRWCSPASPSDSPVSSPTATST